MANPVPGKSLCSDWFFLGQDFAVWTISMETCIFESVYFCFGAKRSNSTFATKTAKKKKVLKLSFLTLKLPAEAKKIEIFPKLQRWMKKTNIFHFLSASHQKCILLSGTECHIINYFIITELARAVPGNIGPQSFLSLRSVRTVMTSGQYSPVRHSCLVSKRLVLIINVNYVSLLSLFIMYLYHYCNNELFVIIIVTIIIK